MISETLVDLSRFQFAMTAMYHFIFVPLTIGLAFLLAIMESVYVLTGKEVYKDMVLFWGKLLGLTSPLVLLPVSPWSSSSAPTGPITATMSAMSLAHR